MYAACATRIYFKNDGLYGIRNRIETSYRDDLGVDGHRAVVAVDTGVDVVGPRRGSRVKRGMERQEAGRAAVAAHRRWWCHLTPVIIVQHPAKVERECVQSYSTVLDRTIDLFCARFCYSVTAKMLFYLHIAAFSS